MLHTSLNDTKSVKFFINRIKYKISIFIYLLKLPHNLNHVFSQFFGIINFIISFIILPKLEENIE